MVDVQDIQFVLQTENPISPHMMFKRHTRRFSYFFLFAALSNKYFLDVRK